MDSEPSPLSKTAKYKKVTKPLLERKRRARINRCLDELKELMVGALEIDDEQLSKLEKADILELTVNHLTKIHQPRDSVVATKKFQAGYGQCAAEAYSYITAVPGLDSNVSRNLITHLSKLMRTQPAPMPEKPNFSPPLSPSSVLSDRQHIYSDLEKSSSDAEDSIYSAETSHKFWNNEKKSSNTKPPSLALDAKYDILYKEALTHKFGHSNKVPSESKDVILQRIRQHIMDKREHENAENCRTSQTPDQWPTFKSHEKHNNPLSDSPHVSSNGTLDLRTVRTPRHDPPYVTQLFPVFCSGDVPIEMEAKNIDDVPERCKYPLDYSSLPPKKKIKLIQFQEQKRQEQIREQFKDYINKQINRTEEGVLPSHYVDQVDPKWRPW